MIIDSHQHFWKLSRNDYKWLTEDLLELYRDFMPNDLYPILNEHQIDKTIVVQAAPTIEETLFLLTLFEKYDWIAGVVGWLDFSSVNFQQNFEVLLRHPGFVGVRPMLQDLHEDDWILRPEVLKNVELLVQHDVPLDLLIKPRHIPYILELLKLFPKLRVVVNHIAKPNIAEQQLDGWKEAIEKIAMYPNAMCKLSGLVTEATHQNWTLEEFQPFITHVVNVFGTERVMFGSDWPVCNLSGTYNDVLMILMENLPAKLLGKDLEMIFGENAKRFYKL
ncbi:amidohydrolase family protein [Lysinibacillus sp. NPDC097195]|uniref:amidohydrolase family protein n=1 Tax=Lysinibacillus sp. NPDC097195 TaxID=3364141 RepID=UPI00381B74C1